MGNNTIHYSAILAILLWVMISCNHPPKSYIFESSDKNSLMDSLLFIEPQHLENGRNVEYFKFKFWDKTISTRVIHPKYLMEGYFLKKGDTLFYASSPSGNWQYFLDFNGDYSEDTLAINFMFNATDTDTNIDTLITQELHLLTESVFIDKAEGARICKIRIFQYEYFLPVENSSLILYISEKRGITGAYFCCNSSWGKHNSADTIYNNIGNTYLHYLQGFTGLYFEPPYGNYE